MAEIALGWLGWTEEQTLYADVNAILIGFEGRRKMLQALIGVTSRPNAQKAPHAKPVLPIANQPGKVIPLTPKVFDELFGTDGRGVLKARMVSRPR